MAQAFKQPPPEHLRVINLKGDWLSLGGVDLQINGALGIPFPLLGQGEQSPRQALQEISRFLWQQGIDGYLATIVTSSVADIHRSLAAIKGYMGLPTPAHTAKLLGVHLEGPCLNGEKRGAHPKKHLKPLTIPVLEEILGEWADIVKIITLAPELDPSGETIAYLRGQNIVVSLGHSQASEAEAKAAFEQGANMVTHAFNAMPSLHHREAGLLGAALVNADVYCGFIADGRHVNTTMLNLLLRAGSYSKQLFLVSDALAPLGLPEGVYPWDKRQITIANGTARLEDGTLAGTTLSLLSGVQNLVRWRICSVDEAIAMATITPRRALSCTEENDRRDRLYVGQSLDSLVRWHLERETHELTWERFRIPSGRD
jgi:N-acetylglucosamine-6-phosphate deacetylase